MKTILVLTDLSKKAENAALFALRIAEKNQANIILYHSLEIFESVNTVESSSWLYENSEVIRAESLTALRRLENNLAAQHEPGAFEPSITLLNEMGYDLGANVNQLVRDKSVDLVVMGTRGNNTISHVFNGSDAGDILAHVSCPVLFVPETDGFDHFKTIVFANDLKKDYDKPISFLVDIARTDNSQIILTHLGDYENKAYKCLSLIKNTLAYSNVTSRLFPLENMGEQLRKFALSVKANLVVLIHHKNDRLENFFYGSESKNMLNYNEIPLLILQG
jgi:nucleotide-binding universal stress UspA family protein